jgi:hypothetical protein
MRRHAALWMVMLFIAGSLPLAADGWEGTWRDTELVGIGPTQDGACESITLNDRTVTLAKSGDGYVGAWLTTNQQRLTLKRKATCRLADTAQPGFGLRMQRWMLTGKLDPATGKMKVVGHSGECTGDWCASGWKDENDTFETTLVLKDGKLVDIGTDASAVTGRAFIPEATYQRGAGELAGEMKKLGGQVANGKCGEFYDAASTLFQKGFPRAKFVSDCNQMGSQIESRQFIDQLYVTSFAKPESWPLAGPYVIFMNRLAGKNGQGVEFAVFARENGSMRVVYWTIQG